MAIERVKEYFRKLGIEERVQELEMSSATVELAAEALHCEPGRIAKTLSFMVDGNPILIVTAGDVKIDNSKYKKQFGAKAKMLTPDEAVTLIGHAVGGVCPFAVNEGVTIYLDESLKKYVTVFPACGSGNSAIELTIEELEKYSLFTTWVDVCKTMGYTQEQSQFIKSLDFMKLGQAINHEQWQSAAMIIRRMDSKAKEVNLTGFERQFTGIRQCINRKDKTQAQQVLSLVISKRVQLIKQMQEK